MQSQTENVEVGSAVKRLQGNIVDIIAVISQKYIIAIQQNAATNLTIQTAYYCVVLLTIRQYAFVVRLILCGLLLPSYVALFYCIAIELSAG